MALPTKMMTQHLNSMLEHLKVSSLIKSRNQTSSSSSSSNSTNTSSTSNHMTIFSRSNSCNSHTPATATDANQDQVDNSVVTIVQNNLQHLSNHNSSNTCNSILSTTTLPNHCTEPNKPTHINDNELGSDKVSFNYQQKEQQSMETTSTVNSFNVNNKNNQDKSTEVTVVAPNNQQNATKVLQIITKRGSINSGRGGNEQSSRLLDVNTTINPYGAGVTTNNAGAIGQCGQRKQSFVVKPIKLKNVITKAETYDTLYTRGVEVGN